MKALEADRQLRSKFSVFFPAKQPASLQTFLIFRDFLISMILRHPTAQKRFEHIPQDSTAFERAAANRLEANQQHQAGSESAHVLVEPA